MSFRRAEQRVEIGNELCAKRVACYAAYLRERLEDTDDVCRFIALAAKRNGREVRAVGFDQQPIGRNHARRVAKRRRLGKRCNAWNGDVEAGRERTRGGG